MIARMRTHELRHLRLLRFFHTLPQAHGGLGIEAALRHEHQPDVVRLGLLHARIGVVVDEVDDEVGQAAREVEEVGQHQNTAPAEDALAEALGGVRGDVVAQLVAQHGGEAVVVARDGEDAAEDEDFVAGRDEGVELVGRIDDVDLPVLVLLAFGGGGQESVEDAGHLAGFGVPGGEDAVFVGRDDLVVLAAEDGGDEFGAEEVEAAPAGYLVGVMDVRMQDLFACGPDKGERDGLTGTSSRFHQ